MNSKNKLMRVNSDNYIYAVVKILLLSFIRYNLRNTSNPCHSIPDERQCLSLTKFCKSFLCKVSLTAPRIELVSLRNHFDVCSSEVNLNFISDTSQSDGSVKVYAMQGAHWLFCFRDCDLIHDCISFLKYRRVFARTFDLRNFIKYFTQ